jgi:mono/diheme cytochrome c family protein
MNLLKPGGVLVPNFQQRLFVGIATFVGILLLVGWVAVNEPARMEVFTLQYQGRSIENGASIFLNNCASCHGVDGKGSGKGPALNNPMLFLRDNPAKVANRQVTEVTQKQGALAVQITDYEANVKKLAEANEKLKTVTPGSDDETKLKAEIDKLNADTKNFDLKATQEQIAALNPEVEKAKAELERLVALGWEKNRDTRLTEVKWGGKPIDYVISTVTSGRPVSSAYWTDPMPAWGQLAGGPLRPDEVRDVAAYIMNFHDGAVKMTPKDVNQQFVVPSLGAPADPADDPTLVTSGVPIGTTSDLKAMAAAGQLAGGRASRGEAKYKTTATCGTCHLPGVLAPATAGTYTRIVDERLKDPANAGKTPEEYIAESIIHPNNYVSPGFAPGVMTQDFGGRLDLKDVQDLIAFLETQK